MFAQLPDQDLVCDLHVLWILHGEDAFHQRDVFFCLKAIQIGTKKGMTKQILKCGHLFFLGGVGKEQFTNRA